jgi:hypothetical protein
MRRSASSVKTRTRTISPSSKNTDQPVKPVLQSRDQLVKHIQLEAGRAWKFRARVGLELQPLGSCFFGLFVKGPKAFNKWTLMVGLKVDQKLYILETKIKSLMRKNWYFFNKLGVVLTSTCMYWYYWYIQILWTFKILKKVKTLKSQNELVSNWCRMLWPIFQLIRFSIISRSGSVQPWSSVSTD